MECPKCNQPLADHATYCGCGWRIIAATKAVNQITDALQDYERKCAKVQEEANATCKRLGLETTEQKRAWLRNHWPQMQAYDTGKAPREPGED